MEHKSLQAIKGFDGRDIEVGDIVIYAQGGGSGYPPTLNFGLIYSLKVCDRTYSNTAKAGVTRYGEKVQKCQMNTHDRFMLFCKSADFLKTGLAFEDFVDKYGKNC